MKYYIYFYYVLSFKNIRPFYAEGPTESGGFDPQDQCFPCSVSNVKKKEKETIQ